MKDEKKTETSEIPDKSLIMARATTIALGIVLATLALLFVILTLIK